MLESYMVMFLIAWPFISRYEYKHERELSRLILSSDELYFSCQSYDAISSVGIGFLLSVIWPWYLLARILVCLDPEKKGN